MNVWDPGGGGDMCLALGSLELFVIPFSFRRFRSSMPLTPNDKNPNTTGKDLKNYKIVNWNSFAKLTISNLFSFFKKFLNPSKETRATHKKLNLSKN